MDFVGPSNARWLPKPSVLSLLDEGGADDRPLKSRRVERFPLAADVQPQTVLVVDTFHMTPWHDQLGSRFLMIRAAGVNLNWGNMLHTDTP